MRGSEAEGGAAAVPHCGTRVWARGKGHMKRESPGERMIDKAMRSLRLQRILLKPAAQGQGGHARIVNGVLLTDAEIVALYRSNRLTRWGIREHAKAAVQGDR